MWSDKPLQKVTADFAQFHEARIAVVLNQGAIVFCGVAMFQCDDDLGNVLRIKSASSETIKPIPSIRYETVVISVAWPSGSARRLLGLRTR